MAMPVIAFRIIGKLQRRPNMMKFLKYYGKVLLGVSFGMCVGGIGLGLSYGFSVFLRTDLRDYYWTALLLVPLIALVVSASHFLGPSERQ
jgi:hypothetical protein